MLKWRKYLSFLFLRVHKDRSLILTANSFLCWTCRFLCVSSDKACSSPTLGIILNWKINAIHYYCILQCNHWCKKVLGKTIYSHLHYKIHRYSLFRKPCVKLSFQISKNIRRLGKYPGLAIGKSHIKVVSFTHLWTKSFFYLWSKSLYLYYHCTMLQKLWKYEVKGWPCWNLIILPPLRFYVISNFGGFNRSKNVIFANFIESELWIFGKSWKLLKFTKIYGNLQEKLKDKERQYEELLQRKDEKKKRSCW